MKNCDDLYRVERVRACVHFEHLTPPAFFRRRREYQSMYMHCVPTCFDSSSSVFDLVATVLYCFQIVNDDTPQYYMYCFNILVVVVYLISWPLTMIGVKLST